jgi:DNA-binding Lrp family transcriptional regulator
VTPDPDPEAPLWLSDRLDDRIVALLESNPGHLAFNGLRRALQAHPESLQRALRRLERGGVVRRDPIGYSLARSGTLAPASSSSERPSHEVAVVELPPGTQVEELLGRLAGKWVGALRWVGLLDDPSDPRLVWAVPGADGRVVAAIRDGRLRVWVESEASPPHPSLLDAAHDLVVLSVRAAGRGRRPAPWGAAQLTPSPSSAVPLNN